MVVGCVPSNLQKIGFQNSGFSVSSILVVGRLIVGDLPNDVGQSKLCAQQIKLAKFMPPRIHISVVSIGLSLIQMKNGG